MNHQNKDASFHLAGWVLFVVCASLFLYVAVRDGDMLMALASLVFLAGCVVFLIPLLFPTAADKEKSSTRKEGSPAGKK